MPVKSVNLPEGLKQQMEDRLEKKDYQNASEFIREAIRDKLESEIRLRPEEIERAMEVRERDRKGEQEWLSLEEVKDKLDIGEAELREQGLQGSGKS